MNCKVYRTELGKKQEGINDIFHRSLADPYFEIVYFV